MKKTRTAFSSLTLFAVVTAASLPAAAQQPQKPNVVFILADNVGYGDLEAYGDGELRGAPTPRIDQLVRERRLRLTQFLVEPACTPSRAALMTGQYSIRNGLSLIGAAASGYTQNFPAADLASRTIHRRAIEVINWGMPAVNYHLMYKAAVQAKGDFNQMIYWSRLPDWKNQTLTPNPDVINLMPFFNTQNAGPIVLEIPPAEGGAINGSIMNYWQAPIEDVGPAGLDRGNGGKYLFLPPSYDKRIVPDGYIPMQSDTYRGFALLRSVLQSGSDADVAKAIAYAKRIKVYPLSWATNPPPTAFVDVADVVYDSTIPYDRRFFVLLNEIVQAEPFLERDRTIIDMLKTVGIERGKPFNPDTKTQEILDSAAKEAKVWFEARYDSSIAAAPSHC
jgi:hypothetical protein